MIHNEAFLTAEWRHIVMVSYEVDPSLLASRVPSGTELDTWNGKALISLVGFLFLRTKVLGIPVPLHQNFEEVNLRFYVRHRGEEGWRRGVVFIKEIVPRWAVALVARYYYGEKYVALPMQHRIDLADGCLARNALVEYSWRRSGQWDRLRVRVTGESCAAGTGSEEEFITEHYWGYVARSSGGSVEYRVEHPPWRVWQVSEATFECDAAALYGDAFRQGLSGKPGSAFVAEGSQVKVYRAKRF